MQKTLQSSIISTWNSKQKKIQNWISTNFISNCILYINKKNTPIKPLWFLEFKNFQNHHIESMGLLLFFVWIGRKWLRVNIIFSHGVSLGISWFIKILRPPEARAQRYKLFYFNSINARINDYFFQVLYYGRKTSRHSIKIFLKMLRLKNSSNNSSFNFSIYIHVKRNLAKRLWILTNYIFWLITWSVKCCTENRIVLVQKFGFY